MHRLVSDARGGFAANEHGGLAFDDDVGWGVDTQRLVGDARRRHAADQNVDLARQYRPACMNRAGVHVADACGRLSHWLLSRGLAVDLHQGRLDLDHRRTQLNHAGATLQPDAAGAGDDDFLSIGLERGTGDQRQLLASLRQAVGLHLECVVVAHVDGLILPYFDAVVGGDDSAAVVANGQALVVANVGAAVVADGATPVHADVVAADQSGVGHGHDTDVDVVGHADVDHLEDARTLRVANAHAFGFHLAGGYRPVVANGIRFVLAYGLVTVGADFQGLVDPNIDLLV